MGNGWQKGAKFQSASGNPYTPIIGVTEKNNSFYVLEGDKNLGRYPDYHKLDIRIDKQFVFDSWSFSIYLDLWNVYNRDNIILTLLKLMKTVSYPPPQDMIWA